MSLEVFADAAFWIEPDAELHTEVHNSTDISERT